MARRLSFGALAIALGATLLAGLALRHGTVHLAAEELRRAELRASVDSTHVADAAGLSRWHPRDAELAELEGRLALNAGEHERARDAFVRARVLRPRWPYATVGLAAALPPGAARDAAIAEAWRDGARESRVVAQLAALALAADSEPLPPLATAIDRAVLAEPERWVDRADRAGRGAWLCGRTGLPNAARARCRRLGWPVDGEPVH